MGTLLTKSGITFAVEPVDPAKQPLSTCTTHEALTRIHGTKIEACSDYTANCVEGAEFHPLIGAAHLAFSQHHPLVFSPDMIWQAIVQGLAQHVNNEPERLRSRLVDHSGKLEIGVEVADFHPGSPENAWNLVIHGFVQALRKHLGRRCEELVSDFSTTGEIERTACEVALVDTFQPYFEYLLVSICGIPEITLEGTTDDWRRLHKKIDYLEPFDLDWWLPSMRHIADQFIRASQADIDLEHWRDIYKRHDAYGGDNINGWLVKLVPYVKNHLTGNFTVRNPLLTDPDAMIGSTSLPSGLSQVPFRCRWPGRDEDDDDPMEFLGGFVGVTQDSTTLALRPKLGWAVRRGDELQRLFNKLSGHEAAPPLDKPDLDRLLKALLPRGCEFPGDFLMFYKKFNGARLFVRDSVAVYSFRPLKTCEIFADSNPSAISMAEDIIQLLPPSFVRFCDLSDGSFVAIELRHNWDQGWKIVRKSAAQTDTAETDATQKDQIIAWSFQEFVARALASGGRLDRL